jgi:hypothetical protein
VAGSGILGLYAGQLWMIWNDKIELCLFTRGAYRISDDIARSRCDDSRSSRSRSLESRLCRLRKDRDISITD